MRAGEVIPMGSAPPIERKRSAVVAQKIGVQRLEQSERLEASGEAVLPRGRAIDVGGARQKMKCERSRNHRTTSLPPRLKPSYPSG